METIAKVAISFILGALIYAFLGMMSGNRKAENLANFCMSFMVICAFTTILVGLWIE